LYRDKPVTTDEHIDQP